MYARLVGEKCGSQVGGNQIKLGVSGAIGATVRRQALSEIHERRLGRGARKRTETTRVSRGGGKRLLNFRSSDQLYGARARTGAVSCREKPVDIGFYCLFYHGVVSM